MPYRSLLYLALSIVVMSVVRSSAQDVIISEILATNESLPKDDQGNRSDWIEIYNQSTKNVNLRNWKLESGDFPRVTWQFPSFIISSGQRMLIYASGRDRKFPNQPLHTNFRLSSEGEYLALVQPNGEIATEFSPAYPPQKPDISFARNESPGDEIILLQDNSPAKALIPTDGNLSLDWTKLDFDDTSWKSGRTGVGYDYPGRIGLDVRQMRNQNESVYIRIPFNVDNLPSFERLILSIQYEDGMVAYLNGQLLVSRNAPTPLRWNSGAPTNRPDNIAIVDEQIVITSSQDKLQEGKNILAIHGLNNLVTSSDLLIRPKIIGYAGGDTSRNYGYSYFPSPRESNGNTVQNLGPEVTFSKLSGTFTSNFSLQLKSDVGFAMRYTTDGSIPNESSTLYNSPIRVTGSTTIRARSFKDDAIGPVITHTFIKLSNDVRSFSSDIPLIYLDTFGSRHPFPQSGWLKTSFSIFEPDATGKTKFTNTPQYTSNAGIRVRGSSTAGRPKPSLSLELWGENEKDKSASLLGMPSESDWILWGPFNFDPSLIRNPLIYELSNQIGSYAVRTRFVEVFINQDRDNLEMSDYFGVYALMEKISRDDDRVDIEKLFPEHRSEPEISGGYIFKIDRTDPGDSGFSAPGQRVLYVEPKEIEMEKPENASKRTWVRNFFNEMVRSTTNRNRPIPKYHEYIDVEAWIDHHLLNVLAFNVDALRLSTYMSLPRGGKLKFGPIWDFDRSMGSTDSRDDDPFRWRSNRGDRGTDFFNYPWWRDLFRDLEFWQAYIDRWQVLNDGELSLANITKVIDSMAGQLRGAAIRNESRWGRFRGTYNSEIRTLKSWYANRISFINSQFLARPQSNIESGTVTAGTQIKLSSEEGGTIYYTTDGSDPRKIGGSVSGAAIRYTAPITVNETVKIRTRVFKTTHKNLTGSNNPPVSSNWSGITDIRLSVDRPPTFGDIIITEINYHPSQPSESEISEMPNIQDNDFEFIELFNSSGQRLDLNEIKFTDGIDFDFANSSPGYIGPGKRLLLVKNKQAFLLRYGNNLEPSVAGEYLKSLSNGGEKLEAVNKSDQSVVLVAEYDDRWYPLTDGLGFSLVNTNPDNPEPIDIDYWSSSSSIYGSPGIDNGPPGASPNIVINEVLLHSDPPLMDMIEIINADEVAIDIGGWVVSDDLRRPNKFRIPEDTILGSGELYVISENQFNPTNSDETLEPFSLNATGDEIFIFSQDENSILTGYANGTNFPGSKSGESFGRFVNSEGSVIYHPLNKMTFGEIEAAPRIGPVIISEIMYTPPTNDDSANTEDEFVELTNFSNDRVALYNVNFPELTWRVRGGIDFDFPKDLWIDPGESLLLVKFDPTANQSKLDSFRTIFNIPNSISVLGPFKGQLNNAGDKIVVKAAEDPQPNHSSEANAVPYYIVDEVTYRSEEPWPIGLSDNGLSMHRLSGGKIGTEPTNWKGKIPSPGYYKKGVPRVAGRLNTNGIFELEFKALPDTQYQIEARESLTSGEWKVLRTIEASSTENQILFQDNTSPLPEGDSRFYRVRIF